MPLRITHVDTKVLVFLVQAMPTSLHAACTIPLNRRTGRQSPAKKLEQWSYFQRLCSNAISNAQSVYFKRAVRVVCGDRKTKVNVKYLQVKVPTLDPSQSSVGSSCIWESRKQERRRASSCSQWAGRWVLTAVPAARVSAAHWFTAKVDVSGLFS